MAWRSSKNSMSSTLSIKSNGSLWKKATVFTFFSQLGIELQFEIESHMHFYLSKYGRVSNPSVVLEIKLETVFALFQTATLYLNALEKLVELEKNVCGILNVNNKIKRELENQILSFRLAGQDHC